VYYRTVCVGRASLCCLEGLLPKVGVWSSGLFGGEELRLEKTVFCDDVYEKN
jgi:hypothetical protein